MEDYKVRYQQKGVEFVTDWLDKSSANRKFNRLLNEKVLITQWAELIMYDDNVDNMVVIKSFDRKSIDFFGHTLVVI